MVCELAIASSTPPGWDSYCCVQVFISSSLQEESRVYLKEHGRLSLDPQAAEAEEARQK